ncbi:hypothetical protein D3C87_1755440 [compost metagenome]
MRPGSGRILNSLPRWTREDAVFGVVGEDGAGGHDLGIRYRFEGRDHLEVLVPHLPVLVGATVDRNSHLLLGLSVENALGVVHHEVENRYD